MKYFFNLSKDEQLRIIEKIAHNLQGTDFDESVQDTLNKVMTSKRCDLTDALIKEPKTALDYGIDSEVVILNIVKQATNDLFEEMKEGEGVVELSRKTINPFRKNLVKKVKEMMLNPESNYYEELRFCDECGGVLREGYYIDGDYFCSDKCLHENYTNGEYLALHAGLDHTDPNEVERALRMTPEELIENHGRNDSDCYWTQFEVDL